MTAAIRERGLSLARLPIPCTCLRCHLGKPGYAFEEEPSIYGIDPDFDPDKRNFQPAPGHGMSTRCLHALLILACAAAPEVKDEAF